MNIDVQVSWAKEHRWQGGECLRRLQTPAYALWLVQGGAIDLMLNDWPGPQQKWRLTPGQAFLAPAPSLRDVVAAKVTGAHWLTLGLSVGAPSMGGVDLVSRIGPPFLWEPDATEQEFLAHWMRACVAEGERRTAGSVELSRFVQQSLAGAVFGLCWRARFGDNAEGFTQAARQHLPEWLAAFLEQIEADPSRSLAEWQPCLPVSPAHLRRIFQRYLGVSPQSYLTARRLDAAKALLTQTDRTAGEIAHAIGFVSQAHFSRCFKTCFGKTPTQFRFEARLPQI